MAHAVREKREHVAIRVTFVNRHVSQDAQLEQALCRNLMPVSNNIPPPKKQLHTPFFNDDDDDDDDHDYGGGGEYNIPRLETKTHIKIWISCHSMPALMVFKAAWMRKERQNSVEWRNIKCFSKWGWCAPLACPRRYYRYP
jgi:hypothetical protein